MKTYSTPSLARKEMPNKGRKEIKKGIARQCAAQSQDKPAPVLSSQPFSLKN
jgi:hypothetical protein